jgi:heme exporter protein D
MNWQNLDSFLSMGGYGFYVWTSFAITFLSLGIEFYVSIKQAPKKEI